MITQTKLKEIFTHDNITGNLRYRVKVRGTTRGIGDIAGKINNVGYRSIGINGREYLEHRLVFLYYNGYIPEQIDHINLNKLDNRLENLREATFSQNECNKAIRSDNTSGYKGIVKTYRKDILVGYRAKVTITNGKQTTISKHFNVKTYSSLEQTLQEAVSWVTEVREQIHKDFCNHGI